MGKHAADGDEVEERFTKVRREAFNYTKTCSKLSVPLRFSV